MLPQNTTPLRGGRALLDSCGSNDCPNRRAHAAALSDGFVGTDDSSLIERLGGRVLVVEGPRDNIKLTVPEDFQLLEAAVQKLYNQRAGK